MSPSFTAKRSGKANRCGHSFEAGDEVFYEKGVTGWLCYECAIRAGLAPRQPLEEEPPPNEPVGPTLRLALALEELASSIRAWDVRATGNASNANASNAKPNAPPSVGFPPKKEADR